MRKAQVSAEFFIFIGLAFLIAISFGLSSITQLKEARLQNENDALKDLGLKIQKEFLIAAYVEDGYYREFDVPDQIQTINYSIITQNSTVTLQSSGSMYIVSIPSAFGNVTKGANKINKTGGVMHIN